MASALITGATGFIGSHVARALLAQGTKVHAFVRTGNDPWRIADIASRLIFHDGDVTDREAVTRAVTAAAPDIVYHLAHYGGNREQSDPKRIREVIIEGTAHILDACRTYGSARVILAGTSSEYGKQLRPMSEDMRPEPDTDYGLAKLWATLYGKMLHETLSFPVTTLRLFTVFGPFESPPRFVPSVALALLRKKAPLLSDPSIVRDFVYIDDVVNAMLLASERPAGVYNIGTGIETSFEDALAAIEKEAHSGLSFTWGTHAAHAHDARSWRADAARAAAVLGWRATTPFSEGVAKTVAWFREHQHLYDGR